MDSNIKVEKLRHHERQKECVSRAKYRQGRRLTAVKVYTVNDESKYIIINGVPAIKIVSELQRLCLKYGDIECLQLLPEYPHEEYTEVYLLKYHKIRSARFAKTQLDGKSFYGGVLHVCYAPELETVEETREKLHDRRRTVAALTRYRQDASSVNPPKKRKNKVLNPAAGRYLAHLRPELKNVSPDLLNPGGKERAGSSEAGGGLLQCASHPDSILQNQNITVTVNSDVSFTSETSPVSKLEYTNGSTSNIDGLPVLSQTVSQGKECAVWSRQNKRQSDFPCITASSKKKIKVFGNKKILSYVSDR
ncbi:uncharacterized protein [Panulirus ornatus]|uniref:uncharacterized protein n=1 Tax=Panulirus ornatus TaxID=150431 RepID=UPI003A88E19B